MFRRDVYENLKGVDIEPNEVSALCSVPFRQLLTQLQLHEYGERLRQCMRMLKDAFPKKKVVFLQMHPFGGDDVNAKYFCMLHGTLLSHDLSADQLHLKGPRVSKAATTMASTFLSNSPLTQ